MKRCLSALLAVLLLLPALSACKEKEVTQQSQVVFYFDTVTTINIYTNDDKLLSDVEEECLRYERLLSKTVEGSDVWNINHANGQRVAVSEETRALIMMALGYSRQSGGRFDITVEPCVALWDFTGEGMGILPDAGELAAAAEKVDWTQVDVNEDGVMIPAGMSIDLGAIAKGYISDMIAKFLMDRGVTSGYLNVGGNVRAIGSKPDGSPWRIGIQDPEGARDQSIVGVVTLSGDSVVTSGIYERQFVKDGISYHHILDPVDGLPSRSDLASATIVGTSSMDADALATACIVMGREKALQFMQEQGIEGVLVTRDRQVYKHQTSETFQLNMLVEIPVQE